MAQNYLQGYCLYSAEHLYGQHKEGGGAYSVSTQKIHRQELSFKCSLRALIFRNKLGSQRTWVGGNISHNMALLLFEILTLCES